MLDDRNDNDLKAHICLQRDNMRINSDKTLYLYLYSVSVEPKGSFCDCST